MTREEKYYREKFKITKTSLSVDEKRVISIMEDYAIDYFKIKVEKLDISNITLRLSNAKRYDINAEIDDYNEYGAAVILEEKSKDGEWIRSNEIDKIINCL